jgi:hypothetical protein
MFSKKMEQIQKLDKQKHFYWNDDLDFILINLLEIYSNKNFNHLIHHVIPILLEVKCIIIFNTCEKQIVLYLQTNCESNDQYLENFQLLKKMFQ